MTAFLRMKLSVAITPFISYESNPVPPSNFKALADWVSIYIYDICSLEIVDDELPKD